MSWNYSEKTTKLFMDAVQGKPGTHLGEIEDPAAVPGLTGLLNDEDPKIRQVAAYALSEIRDPAAYEALVDALRDDDPVVRRTAARALGRRN